jgi:Protein of unknown function (DUF3455)
MMNKRNEIQTITKTPLLCRLASLIGAALSANKATIGALAVLLSGGLTALADDNRAPEVPEIAVPEFNKVSFHGLGVGFQIYTWDGVSWGRPVPDATLFDDEGNIVADHFAGPTWKSNSGSEVGGTLAKPPLTVDLTAIPWLLLSAVKDRTHGPGIFAETTFIQRVNTVGGNPPSEDGTFIGQVASVPYVADYFFYRQTTD